MTIKKVRLPGPYQTKCIDYGTLGFEDQHHCIEACVAEKSLKSFKKISLLAPVREPSDLMPFSLDDFEADDESLKFWKIQEACQSQCKNSAFVIPKQ